MLKTTPSGHNVLSGLFNAGVKHGIAKPVHKSQTMPPQIASYQKQKMSMPTTQGLLMNTTA